MAIKSWIIYYQLNNFVDSRLEESMEAEMGRNSGSRMERNSGNATLLKSNEKLCKAKDCRTILFTTCYNFRLFR